MAARNVMRNAAQANAKVAHNQHLKRRPTEHHGKGPIKTKHEYDAEAVRERNFWESVDNEISIVSNHVAHSGRAARNSSEVITQHEHIEKLRELGLFHPGDEWKVLFDLFIGVLIFISLIIVPYRIGFQIETTDAYFWADVVMDTLFLVDIAIRFNTAYQDEKSEMLVLDREKIAKNYLKLWFWIDLASSFPFGIIADAIGNDSLLSLRFIRIVRLSRLFKLVRLAKLKRLQKQFEELDLSPNLVNMFSLIFQITFVAHVMACFWFYLSTKDVTGVEGPSIEYEDADWSELPQQAQVTWVTSNNLQHSPVLDQYCASFYWVITTMLSIGYGEIAGTNNIERIYCIFTMLVGGVIFGAVIAQVTSIIENQNPQLRAYKMRMDECKAYLAEKKLPEHTRVQVLENYSYYLQRKSTFSEAVILGSLPPDIVTKIVYETYYREICGISLFSEAATVSERRFVVHLIRNIKPQKANRGDVIFNAGDVSEHIVFLMSGLVRISQLNDGTQEVVAGYTSKGGFFGDFECGKRTLRLADYKAAMHCTLLSIPMAVFEEAEFLYPQAAVKWRKLLKYRYANFMKAIQKPPIRSPTRTTVSPRGAAASVTSLITNMFSNMSHLLSPVGTASERRKSMDFTSGKSLPSRLQLWVDGELRLPNSLSDEFKISTDKEVVTYRVMYLDTSEEGLAPITLPGAPGGSLERTNSFTGNRKMRRKIHAAQQSLKIPSPSISTKAAPMLSSTSVNGDVPSGMRRTSGNMLGILSRTAKNLNALSGISGINNKKKKNSPNKDGNSSSSSSSDSDTESPNKSGKNALSIDTTTTNTAGSMSSLIDSEETPTNATEDHDLSEKEIMRKREAHPDGKIIYVEASMDFFAYYNLLHPDGIIKMHWDTLISCGALWSFVVIPMEAGFSVVYNYRASLAYVIIDYFLDFLYLMDIFVSLNTSYYSDLNDAYVLIRSKIYETYLKGQFWVDVFATVPLDVIVLSIATSINPNLSDNDMRVIRLLKLLQLVRIIKLLAHVRRVEQASRIAPAIFDLMKLIFYVFFIGHTFCCVWWAITESMTNTSWMDDSDNDYSIDGSTLRDETLINKYIASLYLTMATLTTVGYGDITPANTSERFVNIFIELVGASVFGYMVASVSTLLGSLNYSDERVRERLAEVHNYLDEKKCPKQVSEVVIRHFKHKFAHISAFDEDQILKRLPQRMSVEIILHNHAAQLNLIPIFQFIPNKSVSAYIFSLLEASYYDADQSIICQGDEATEIVFIVRGQAMVVQEKLPIKKIPGFVMNKKKKSEPKIAKGIIAKMMMRASRAKENVVKKTAEKERRKEARKEKKKAAKEKRKKVKEEQGDEGNASSSSSSSSSDESNSDSNSDSDSDSNGDEEDERKSDSGDPAQMNWFQRLGSTLSMSLKRVSPGPNDDNDDNDDNGSDSDGNDRSKRKRKKRRKAKKKKERKQSPTSPSNNASKMDSASLAPKRGHWVNEGEDSTGNDNGQTELRFERKRRINTSNLDKNYNILGVLNEGDFAGYQACLVKDAVHSASVVAIQPCSAYSLSKNAIKQLIAEHPSIGSILKSALARSIEQLQKELGKNHIIQGRGKFLKEMRNRFKKEVKSKTPLTPAEKAAKIESEMSFADRLKAMQKKNGPPTKAPDSPRSPTPSRASPTTSPKRRLSFMGLPGLTVDALVEPVITPKMRIQKVEKLLNNRTVHYDSEEEKTEAVAEIVGHATSQRLRMRETFTGKSKKEKINIMADLEKRLREKDPALDEGGVKNEVAKTIAAKALIKRTEGGRLRRHRSYGDIRLESEFSSAMRVVFPTVTTNPFDTTPIYSSYESTDERRLDRLHPAKKPSILDGFRKPARHNAAKQEFLDNKKKLREQRRQSFPSYDNMYWKNFRINKSVI